MVNQTFFVEMMEPMMNRVRNLFNSGGWVIREKNGVEGSDRLEDEISKLSEGEDCFHLAFSKEEGDTDAFNEEL